MFSIGKWASVVEEDFPPRHPITARTKQVVKKKARHFRCSMRVATGRFYEDVDYDAWRERILSTKLP